MTPPIDSDAKPPSNNIYSEIARVLGCSVSTVKDIEAKALRKLRRSKEGRALAQALELCR